MKAAAGEFDASLADLRASYWLYRLLPQWAIGYAQLARLDRPIGWKLLLWPCLWGLLLAYCAQGLTFSSGAMPLHKADYLPIALAHYCGFSPLEFFIFNAVLFLIGAIAMRGAGCAYNDIVDYKIDAKVARTATRPLPSGRVSRAQAAGFILLQCFIGLIVLLQMNKFTIALGFCSLLIVALYPFVKRFSNWPQAVLGLAFNWGALVGFAAVSGHLAWSAVLLYGGAVFWTIGYDTIYAHQDREYDALIGVHSTARLFGAHTRFALIILYALTSALFLTAFWLAGAGIAMQAGVILAICLLIYQICRFDMNNPALCLKLFKSNSGVGWVIFIFGCLGPAFKC